MKFTRLIVCVALLIFCVSSLRNVSSQQAQLPQQRTPRMTRDYVPPIRIPTEGPISFEEFPALSPGRGVITRLSNQYEEARGIVFNDVGVFDYPNGFAHSGTKAIERCSGVEFGCDTRFVMTFPLKPQRRVKVWFGYA